MRPPFQRLVAYLFIRVLIFKEFIMNTHKTYGLESMADARHVSFIESKLKYYGSKFPSSLEERLKEERKNGEDNSHSLALMLYLARGQGTYAISDEQILSIKSDEFELDIGESSRQPPYGGLAY